MDITLFIPLAAGVVTALTQGAKAVFLPDRWAPVFEVVLGVVGCVAGVSTGAVTMAGIADLKSGAAIFWAVIDGCIIGLSAGGLYTYAKTARGESSLPATTPAPAKPATP